MCYWLCANINMLFNMGIHKIRISGSEKKERRPFRFRHRSNKLDSVSWWKCHGANCYLIPTLSQGYFSPSLSNKRPQASPLIVYWIVLLRLLKKEKKPRGEKSRRDEWPEREEGKPRTGNRSVRGFSSFRNTWNEEEEGGGAPFMVWDSWSNEKFETEEK